MSNEAKAPRLTHRHAAYQIACALHRHGFEATEDRVLEEIAAAVNEPIARKFDSGAWRSLRRFTALVARELDDLRVEAEIHARFEELAALHEKWRHHLRYDLGAVANQHATPYERQAASNTAVAFLKEWGESMARLLGEAKPRKRSSRETRTFERVGD